MTDSDIQQVSCEVREILVESGYTRVLNLSNKLDAITTMCVHSVIFSRNAAIHQLAFGLKPILDIARKYPEELKVLFVNKDGNNDIDADKFKSLLEFEDVEVGLKDMFLKYIDTEGNLLAIYTPNTHTSFFFIRKRSKVVT